MGSTAVVGAGWGQVTAGGWQWGWVGRMWRVAGVVRVGVWPQASAGPEPWREAGGIDRSPATTLSSGRTLSSPWTMEWIGTTGQAWAGGREPVRGTRESSPCCLCCSRCRYCCRLMGRCRCSPLGGAAGGWAISLGAATAAAGDNVGVATPGGGSRLGVGVTAERSASSRVGDSSCGASAEARGSEVGGGCRAGEGSMGRGSDVGGGCKAGEAGWTSWAGRGSATTTAPLQGLGSPAPDPLWGGVPAPGGLLLVTPRLPLPRLRVRPLLGPPCAV